MRKNTPSYVYILPDYGRIYKLFCSKKKENLLEEAMFFEILMFENEKV